MSDRGQTQAAVVSERKNKKYSHFLCRHLCIQLDINSDEQSESDDSLLRVSLEESLMRPTGDYICMHLSVFHGISIKGQKTTSFKLLF